MINFFQRKHPSVDVELEMRKASEGNPHIKSYVDAIFKNRLNKKKDPSTFDYKFISEHLKMNRWLVPESRFAEISIGDVKKLADDFQANSSDDCKTVLVDAYNKSTCAKCRKSIIEILMKHQALPSKIFEEMQFDCNLEIQKLSSKTWL